MANTTVAVQSEITVAAPPTTADVSSQMLAAMAALTGVPTDYNRGSQVRTFSEAAGAVMEQQGVWDQALAFQTIVYGAMATLGIFPGIAVPSSGTFRFASSLASGAPPVGQNVAIPLGTIVSTTGGIQFQTSAAGLLASGSVYTDVTITAVNGGVAGNVPPGAINQIVNGLAYPLVGVNVSGTGGGSDAETPSQTQARYAAARAAIPGSTPSSIANAAIGVSASGTGEQVMFSTLYEPWITMGSGFVGWTLYIDNGTGMASSGLIDAVIQVLSGSGMASGTFGYRDAGVPYAVSGVTPTIAAVTIDAAVINGANLDIVSGAISSAVSGYFSLPFGITAEQAQIAAVVANSSLGLLSSLNVSLFGSGGGSPVSGVMPINISRVILGTLLVNVTQPPS